MNEANKWHLLQSKLKRKWIGEIFAKLSSEGIEAVLIKGASVEMYYPVGVARPSTDIDIAVSPDDFAGVKRLYGEGHLGRYNIDIHEGLRHFDNRDWETVFQRTRLVELEGLKIRMLSEEDSLRLMCIHWLTDGGERKDRLRDICYLVQNRSDSFDWDYFLDSNGPTRRRWVVSAIGLAGRFLDLNTDSLPIAEDVSRLPDWLVKTVEKRWSDETKFAPLDHDLRDAKAVLSQLRLRFPPNAIMATVALEGEFDHRSRSVYQIRYFLSRFIPSLRRSLSNYWRILFRKTE